MLSSEQFDQWCLRLDLSDQAKEVVTHIHTFPPARHVQSAAGNVSGMYPSVKMGCSIQFESHKDELPFVSLIDQAQAESSVPRSLASTALPCPTSLSLTIGAPVILDGKVWTIFNPGETEVLLFSEDKQLMPVPNAAFEELIRTGRLTGLTGASTPPKYEEGCELGS